MVIKVIEIRDDAVVCTISAIDSEKIVYLDKELFRVLPEIGDILHHIEHGFCDLSRNNLMICGFVVNYKWAVISYRAKAENDIETIEKVQNWLQSLGWK